VLKNETRDCSGVSVTSTQLPALMGFKLMTKLGKILAPVLAIKDVRATMNVQLEDLVPAITQLLVNIDGENIDDLCARLFASTTALVTNDAGARQRVELREATGINAAFEGNMPAMLGAMQLAIEVNFGDFLRGVAAAGSAAGDQTATA